MPEDNASAIADKARKQSGVQMAPQSAVPSQGGGSGTTDKELVRFVVKTSTVVSSLIALSIILFTAIMPFYGEDAPDELINWGGIIIGFYFGTFASLMKDWLTARNDQGEKG